MTSDQWVLLKGHWCEILVIKELPFKRRNLEVFTESVLLHYLKDIQIRGEHNITSRLVTLKDVFCWEFQDQNKITLK